MNKTTFPYFWDFLGLCFRTLPGLALVGGSTFLGGGFAVFGVFAGSEVRLKNCLDFLIQNDNGKEYLREVGKEDDSGSFFSKATTSPSVRQRWHGWTFAGARCGQALNPWKVWFGLAFKIWNHLGKLYSYKSLTKKTTKENTF